VGSSACPAAAGEWRAEGGRTRRQRAAPFLPNVDGAGKVKDATLGARGEPNGLVEGRVDAALAAHAAAVGAGLFF